MELIYETETWGVRDQRWVRSQHGTAETVQPVTLDMTDADWTQATHFPIVGSSGYLVSGIPLKKIAASENRWTAWIDFATDGLLEAFLLSGDQEITTPLSPTQDELVVDVMTHGMVRLDYLPVTVLTTDLPAGLIASLND